MSDGDDSSSGKRWFPLESNPAVMNAYVEKLGFPTHAFSFCDVLSFEEWALDMVSKPVVGVLMLFPKKLAAEAFAKEEEIRIESTGQVVSPDVYFMKQTVGNACGTVGLLHAIGNMRHHVAFDPASYLARFFDETTGKTPDEIGEYLEKDDELQEIHGGAAQAGQSEQLAHVADPIVTHFVALSCVDGHLYELDGDKKFPINHGASSPDTLLQDACRVVKLFMARDEGDLRFTILALAQTPRAKDDDM